MLTIFMLNLFFEVIWRAPVTVYAYRNIVRHVSRSVWALSSLVMNDYSVVATHLICVNIWGQRSAFVLQLLNLTCVVGFMTSPLLVKPFLHAAVAADDNSTRCDSSHNSTVITPPPCDVAATSYDAVTHVFLIVAAYSLLVGLLMLTIFIKDHHARRTDIQLGGIVPMSESAAETDQRLYSTTSQCEHDLETTTTTLRVDTFRVKIALLFFVFNFFYGGIEVGYAGLIMTYVVTYLHWTKDDATTLTFLLQASNALVTAVSVWLTKYVQPQVDSYQSSVGLWYW